MSDARYLKEYLKHQKSGNREFMNRSALNMQQKSDSVKLTSIVGKSPDPKGTNSSVYKNSHGTQSLTKTGPNTQG
jgi:hypothetical protein